MMGDQSTIRSIQAAMLRFIGWPIAIVLLLSANLALANPFIIFSAGTEDKLDTSRLIRVPQTGMVSLERIASACNLGRGGDLRVYDLSTGECAEQPGAGMPAANRPSLDQSLEGTVLEGQPVQAALDAGLFV